MQVQPYLFFEGRTEEAIEFYKKALDAKVEMVMRYKDGPPEMGAGDKIAKTKRPPADKVMHAEFRIGDTHVMASDGMCAGRPSFQGFSLSVTARDEAEANRRFAALAEGGKVQQPLIKTFFSPAFGMVADRFGVSWMVVVPGQQKP
jgi:PhnB protein